VTGVNGARWQVATARRLDEADGMSPL